jgi:hypothetical protein
MPDAEPTDDERSNPTVALPPDIAAVRDFEREIRDSDRRKGRPKNGEQRPSHAAHIGAKPEGLKVRLKARVGCAAPYPVARRACGSRGARAGLAYCDLS